MASRRSHVLQVIARMLVASAILFFACLLPAEADSINDIVSPGDIIQGHIKIDGECTKCHKRFDKNAQSGLCKDCHKDIAKDITDKHGYHGHMKEEKPCKECHTEHKGRNAKIAEFDTKKFDHADTDFLLKDKHAEEKVKCKDCHLAEKKYRDAATTCNGCHKKDDKHKGGLGTDCAKCHVVKDWKTTNFDHDKTKYPLHFKHVDVKCLACHIGNKYKDTPTQCNACHKKDDKHKGSFGPKCEICHTERGWKEILFDHDKKTKYKLLFKHREIKCVKCHTGDLYKDKLKMTCDSCHKKDDKHKGNFGPKCESCHTEKGWKEILFDHDKKTKYPLLWKHRDVKCVSCHKGDLFKDKLKMTCDSCHTKDDKHKGNFGQKCETCHVEREWGEILFDHDKKTKYPLLGKHRPPAKCVSCHKGDLYKDKLKSICFACHEKDDKHKGQEGKKCESCHNETSWKKAKFDHRQSKFPLTGKHVQTECKKCHLEPTFKDAKSDCWSCHEKQDKEVHKRRLGTKCETCHNTRDWKVWDYDHDKANFKLEGKHKEVPCHDCHKNPVEKKISLADNCYSCHAKVDEHNDNFGHVCERCHVASSWKTIKGSGKLLQ
jgi:hypothetical protein